MKNLIINNINDLTETLKMNKIIKKTTPMSLQAPNSNFSTSFHYKRNNSDNTSTNEEDEEEAEDEVEQEVNIKALNIQSDDDEFVVENFEQTYSIVNNEINKETIHEANEHEDDDFIQSLNLIKSIKTCPTSPKSTSSNSSSCSSLSIPTNMNINTSSTCTSSFSSVSPNTTLTCMNTSYQQNRFNSTRPVYRSVNGFNQGMGLFYFSMCFAIA